MATSTNAVNFVRAVLHSMGSSTSAGSEAETQANRAGRYVLLRLNRPADGSASATTAEYSIAHITADNYGDANAVAGDFVARVVALSICADAAVTAADATNAVWTFSKRDNTGGGKTTVATVTTKTTASGGTGNLTAFLPYRASKTAELVPAAALLVLGGSLTAEVSKVSTGTQLPAHSIELILARL